MPFFRSSLAALTIAALAAAAGCAPSGAPSGVGTSSAAPIKAGKTMLAIYMVGSDLEEAGAGTSDMREMLEGYKALPPEARANVDLFIGFGGSKKPGWQGITYMDTAGVLKDAEDDIFGNTPAAYQSVDATADMGSGLTLQAFLTKAKAHMTPGSRVFLDMWDHGGSYGGFGYDRNSDNLMTLGDLKTALDQTDFHADILGFDACLMGSLEVAGALKAHAKYLVASEEEEPGHGWDYTPLIDMLGRKPDASLVDVGKGIVDAFVTSPRHQKSGSKTLAVIDLERVAAIQAGLDALIVRLGNQVTGFQPLADASSKAMAYGIHKGRADATSVDLADMVGQIKVGLPDAAPQADALAKAVTDAVVYSRQDGTKPRSTGISVFSPRNTKALASADYTLSNSATDLWFGFLKALAAGGGDAAKGPVIGTESPFTAPDDPTFTGFQMEVTAPGGVLVEVDLIYGFVDAAGTQMTIAGLAPEARLDNPPNIYVLPKWDGMAFYMLSGGKKTLVPLAYANESEAGGAQYVASAKLNGQDAVMRVLVNKEGVVDRYWITPLVNSQHGNGLTERQQLELKAGDQIAFYQPVANLGASGATRDEYGTVLTIADAPKMIAAPVEGNAVFFTIAYDIAGRTEISTPHTVGEK
ncbi:MAG: hypothetical protein JWM80_422 [Cyanobacteria bacterium RYN_339]|nr:hypothetical protein [Cyanobacteria bacterium RYN_339]